MERLLVGKASFQNREHTATFYKAVVLESLTDRQFQSGQRGWNASEYFVEKALYDSLPDDLEKMPRVELNFDVIGGKAYLASATFPDAVPATKK